MPRYKPVHRDPLLLPVVLAEQIQPGTFEFALDHLIDHELDLSALDAKFRNDLKETAENWGQVSPRLKDAVVEGASEKVPEKYRNLVQDYYRSLATKATERK